MPEQSPEPLADVNTDLTRRVVIDTHRMTWESSPSGTGWRKPLYRHRGKFGPVTSLVRYAPGDAFPEHAHPRGEGMLVLEGEFGDEHGQYPEGTRIRSPHMSQHSLFSESGCLIYVRIGGL